MPYLSLDAPKRSKRFTASSVSKTAMTIPSDDQPTVADPLGGASEVHRDPRMVALNPQTDDPGALSTSRIADWSISPHVF